jgi:hypothetical protein
VKSRNRERIEVVHWKEDTCREILSIEDSYIRVQRRKSFDFASSEVARESQPSILGG